MLLRQPATSRTTKQPTVIWPTSSPSSPLPGTPEGNEFWCALEDAGGNAALYTDPGNMGGPSFDRLVGGNEAGIADRVLSFLAELDDQQRDAVTKVIGDALAHDTLVAGSRYLG